MSRRITTWIIFIALVLSSSTYAATSSSYYVCGGSDTTVLAFFNGVNTTPTEAQDDLIKLQAINGSVTSNGKPIEYSVMYNYTNGLEDFAETFEQRFKEEVLLKDRWELFFQMLDDKGSWWDNIVQKVPELIKDGNDWRKLLVSNFAKNLSKLLSSLLTEQNYQEHRAKIDDWVVKGKKLLFIAHSQGNLFANEAYRYTTQKISTDFVKVIHIAPASPTTNGPHILADQDFVINALRVLGTVPSITHLIPIYKPFGNNAGRDRIGHSLIQTYLNPAFGMYNTIKDDITQALNNLQPKPKDNIFRASVNHGYWVPIRIYVYEKHTGIGLGWGLRNESSAVGKIVTDYDEGKNFFKETYTLGCDKSHFVTGIYRVTTGALPVDEDYNVTEELSTDEDGVIASVSGMAKSMNFFGVRVSFDDKTNKYSVSPIDYDHATTD